MKKSLIVMLSALLLSCSLFAIPASAYQTGWVSNISNGVTEWEYIYSDMTAPMGWTYIDGDWYFFGEDGVANSNIVLKSGNNDYYLKNDCRMAKSEWVIFFNGRIEIECWANENGALDYSTSRYPSYN